MQQMNILSAITTQDTEINNKNFEPQQEGSNENGVFSSLVDKEVAKSRSQNKPDEQVDTRKQTTDERDKAAAANNDNSQQQDGKMSSSASSDQADHKGIDEREKAAKKQKETETKVNEETETKVNLEETQNKEARADKSLTQSEEFISLLYKSDQALNSKQNKQESNSIKAQSQTLKEAVPAQQNSENDVPIKAQTKSEHTLREFIESLPDKPMVKDSNVVVTDKEALAQSLKNQQLTPEALAAKQLVASEQKAKTLSANNSATETKLSSAVAQQEASESKVKSLQAEIKSALAGGEDKLTTEQGKNAILLDESAKASKHSKSKVSLEKIIQQSVKAEPVTTAHDGKDGKHLLSSSQNTVEENDAVEQAISKAALSAEKSMNGQGKDAVAVNIAKPLDKESKTEESAGNVKVTQKAGEATEQGYSATNSPPIIKQEENKAVAVANTTANERHQVNQSRKVNSRTESALQTPHQQSEKLIDDDNAELESKIKEKEAELLVKQEPTVNEKNLTTNNKNDTSVTQSQVNARTSTELYNYNSTQSQASQTMQAAESLVHNVAGDVAHIQKNNVALQQETISIFRKDFANAVKDKVMLVISQKLQQFDISLDPPEFGNMQVRVNLQAEQASVNFVVQNQQAKDALEQNMHKLRDMLSEQGVDVGGANVEQQSQQASDDEQGLTGEGDTRGSLANEDPEATEHLLSSGLFNSSATGVDYFV